MIWVLPAVYFSLLTGFFRVDSVLQVDYIFVRSSQFPIPPSNLTKSRRLQSRLVHSLSLPTLAAALPPVPTAGATPTPPFYGANACSWAEAAGTQRGASRAA
ncbi:hypothetical protein DFH08DRAFT_459089 [Mycena albidolilacea]|uniref:Secreted protein n=1 Tax=Mycena albidolilacea TaxID=1033008 RepID=A0AAD7EWQ9_9AGAR|nr:hypothetical protein DFH08DRAFT_459089 [Mycena albidolilacea]